MDGISYRKGGRFETFPAAKERAEIAMVSRRTVLRGVPLGALAFVAAGCSARSLRSHKETSGDQLKTRNPRNALVLWYSQTGHTQRYGRLIAHTLTANGLRVQADDMRSCSNQDIANHDLIIIGSPVFYYDVPSNVSGWIESMPSITDTAVASFVSFGGPEGNQHNVACAILDLLQTKGGIPVGMASFMNMGAYPTPTWSGPGSLAHRHLPSEDTYSRAREYALDVLKRVHAGETLGIEYRMAFREFLGTLPLVWFNKLLTTKHSINREKCIGCNTCKRGCPVGAIAPEFDRVRTESCILCYGCLNNCPTQAVEMEVFWKSLYGFQEFMRKNHIRIAEPVELQ
jgi:ferredoxin/flavodoxin